MSPREHRRFGPGPYLREIAPAGPLAGTGRVRALPAVDYLELPALRLDAPVTFLIGENGSGKSTLLEAIAAAAGFLPEGGPLTDDLREGDGAPHRAVPPAATDRHAPGLHLTPTRPRSGFFLRAESFFNVAALIDRLGMSAYGDRDLHAQSHGESFVSLAANRFGGEGLFLLDEPEAALSVTSSLAFMDVVARASAAGSQFVVATHSPILLAAPGARIFDITATGATEVAYDDCEPVRLHRAFLDSPSTFLRHLGD